MTAAAAFWPTRRGDAEACLAQTRAILQRKTEQFEEMAGRSKLSDATCLTIRRTLHWLRAEDI